MSNRADPRALPLADRPVSEAQQEGIGRLKRFISLGAGVQSTTLALMAARGEIGPMPDGAIFADTQWEPAAVYRHLDWLCSPGVLPFPVYRVTEGSLRDTVGATRPTGRFLRVDIPAFVTREDGVTPAGMVNRSCTRDFKIVPIRRKVRELLGIAGKRSPRHPIAEQWIGISADEATRMKPSTEPWLVHRWPLIEKFMARKDCLAWLRANGYPEPPKSSCIGCPFHSDAQWRALTPAEKADAIEVDERLRAYTPKAYRTKGRLFLHRSCVPLAEADLSEKRDDRQANLFENECEGMCGV